LLLYGHEPVPHVLHVICEHANAPQQCSVQVPPLQLTWLWTQLLSPLQCRSQVAPVQMTFSCAHEFTPAH